ncbi:unnamed protein product [Thlaspi arvense]|uniref:Phloem protein 2 n=1 Tax=Thlaspi arvense TaxID=13288 RepID=A0AAU9RM41_THLAR|nr:unnamed protein product [Thlaspi arvense]
MGYVKTVLDRIPVEGNADSSMIYARKIQIAHSDNPENWTWSSIHEAPNEVAIATMKEEYWTNITGNFNTRKLTPETKYEVVFVVKLEENADGWHEPVKLNLKMVMHDKREFLQEQVVYLDTYKDDDEWVDIKAGDFVAPPNNLPARITFTMSQHDDSIRKTGLLVKGAAIRAMD